MEKITQKIRRFGAGIFAVLILAVGLSGQAPQHNRISLVTDWSHRHMIYSAPRSLMQAFQLQSEPRYLQQHFRRAGVGVNNGSNSWGDPFRRNHESALTGDWSLNMGNGSTGLVAATVGAGRSPAKFSFDVSTANCASATQPDFVVYNTGSVPATTTTPHGTDTFTGVTGAGTTTTVGPTTYVWHTSAGSCNGVNLCVYTGGSTAAEATDLVAAVNGSCGGNACAPNSAVTAAVSGSVASFTSKTAGAGGNFALSTNGTGQTLAGGSGGSNAQASIIAYDNLYSGCTGTAPQIYWAYNTGGTVLTSPVLSLDGLQIAFIHSSGSGASLVLLRWVAGQGNTYSTTTNAPSPDLTATTGSGYASCKNTASSCMLTLAFANGVNDTNSPPYYDYNSDVLFVADNTGNIHKFTGVFGGTPTEVGNPWVTLTANNIVDGAIYDSVSGRVFAGDSGGFFYNVACTISAVATPCSTAGVATAVNKSTALTVTTNGGIVDSPIVDGTAGQAYVFGANDTAGVANRSRVWQFPVNFANTTGATTSAQISTSVATAPVYAGAFDNAYFTSANSSSPSGNLYVCGTSTVTHEPTLYQIAITSNAMATTATTGPVLTNGAATCSDVTEFFNSNNSTDLIFVSVTTAALATIGGSSSGCTAAAGCLMSFMLPQTSPFTIPAATSAGMAVAGGASAVIIDNQVPGGTEPGASQVYFSPLTTTPQTCGTGGSGGCAIQASQATLH